MKRNRLIAALAALAFASGAAATVQSRGEGFAWAACEATANTASPASGAEIHAGVLQDSKEPSLTTGLADSIHCETLPGTVDPSKLFSPLLKLERVDDGSFIVNAAGMYEATLQSYSLDANDGGRGRVAGFYPAPCCKGRRAAVVSSILKNAELHPEILQGIIQQLLWAVVAGTDLEEMPANIQQAAIKILPHDLALSLQRPAQADASKKALMAWLDHSKSPAASATEEDANGIPSALNPGSARVGSGVPASSPLPVERGVWALMPGGFFMRFLVLPDGCSRVQLQIIVPEALGVSSTSPLLFDPTQFLAVYTQTPALRLGITLRNASNH